MLDQELTLGPILKTFSLVGASCVGGLLQTKVLGVIETGESVLTRGKLREIKT
jgi:hypothetical protein